MFTTINPTTEEIIHSYSVQTPSQVEELLGKAHAAFLQWQKMPLKHRAETILNLSSCLRKEKINLAHLMTLEMGKPISQSYMEVEKCCIACEYYAKHAEELLQMESLTIGKSNAFITLEPLGIILGIMPWNFPLWQVFRFAIASFLVGNSVIVKPAPNVIGTALSLETFIRETGFPENLFRILLIDPSSIESVIADPRVAAVTLTGSEQTGRSVASLAGRHLKKVVLELGGSDPFIILKDVDLSACVKPAMEARLINSGQSCIAAKRFIVQKEIYPAFVEQLITLTGQVPIGDPLEEKTQVGPLARIDLLEKLDKQVHDSIALGAQLLLGGSRLPRKGYFYAPTILSNIKKGMPAYHEELFGPVFSLFEADTAETAIQIANDSSYGLGASIWTGDLNKAKELAKQLQVGTVAINGKVASDVHLPFGGNKCSGYGRELSHYGVSEFANIKSIVVNS